MIVRQTSFSVRRDLEGWAFATSTAVAPDALGDELEWLALPGPMTVAAGLRAHGRWDLATRRAFDEETFWFRAKTPELAAGRRTVLCLDGLATLADVFVDGEHVLRSENMFHAHRVDITEVCASGGVHELAIRFAPLTSVLAVKRPRPRWKTRLVTDQQLRYVRTSLAGRMPGWSPPVVAVGPWKSVAVEQGGRLVERARLRTRLEGEVGVVDVELTLSDGPAREGTLHVGEHAAALAAGSLRIDGPARWWPHTHGAPVRYPARITLDDGGEIDLGFVAFRTIRADTTDGGFTLVVNGAPIFARGAAWTTTDIATLTGTDEAYRAVLARARAAGMNMVRQTGTLFYESDVFYDVCDELGILVWQDFMFANMDYPFADEAFRASVGREAEELLRRLEARPCLAVLCGGSEVEQQAAMFGAAREIWRSPLFSALLPSLASAITPDVPYLPSTPSGGALPFHVDEGVAHYYGVGAYLRPLEDARRARVRFAAECLALACVPEDDLFSLFLGDGDAPVVSARWKERTAKDNGSAWDFEDVRDHYLEILFEVDPVRLRYEDRARYLALSRVTAGEVMARTFAEFRRHRSSCAGALVWFLQDLWPGAGWGVLDARGQPKSAFWYLRRALQPRAVFITEEGVNGLHLHAVNDGAEALDAHLHFVLYREGEVKIAEGSAVVVVPPRGTARIAADALLPSFYDTARAYRFGPPGHDLAVATLIGGDGAIVSQATHLHDFAHAPAGGGLSASLVQADDGTLKATVRSTRFAHAVHLELAGWIPDDNYFDLAPGAAREVVLRAAGSSRITAGEVTALNVTAPVRLVLG